MKNEARYFYYSIRCANEEEAKRSYSRGAVQKSYSGKFNPVDAINFMKSEFGYDMVVICCVEEITKDQFDKYEER